MNKITKIFMYIMIFTILIFVNNEVQAYYNDKVVVHKDKNWIIKLNKSIELNDLNKSNIEIIDSLNNKIPVNINISDNNRNIIIKPLDKGYTLGENYRLIINKDLRCKEGSELNKKFQFDFSIDNLISNKEIINLLKTSENKVFDMVYSTTKDIKIKDGKEYVPFKKQFNSERKVYYYLRRYFSNDMIWKLINYFDIRYVDGEYCISRGDYGLKVNWNKTSVVNKSYINKNILEIMCREFEDNDYNNIKIKLVFIDNNWVIDNIYFKNN